MQLQKQESKCKNHSTCQLGLSRRFIMHTKAAYPGLEMCFPTHLSLHKHTTAAREGTASSSARGTGKCMSYCQVTETSQWEGNNVHTEQTQHVILSRGFLQSLAKVSVPLVLTFALDWCADSKYSSTESKTSSYTKLVRAHVLRRSQWHTADSLQAPSLTFIAAVQRISPVLSSEL